MNQQLNQNYNSKKPVKAKEYAHKGSNHVRIFKDVIKMANVVQQKMR